MEIKVNYLDNLRLEALFDDFNVVSDQPIRYKGDGSAPGPFDYFLASSAMCAAYFVKVYCNARDIPTHNIRLSQNNIVDPENRYKQTFKILLEVPDDISDKDKEGMVRSIDRCTVKRTIQNNPDFIIETVSSLDDDAQGLLTIEPDFDHPKYIVGKDLPLDQTIANLTSILENVGVKVEIASWRNIVPNVWSLHLREASSPLCFTNGKGATKEAALCSALGEYIERMNNNFYYNDQYWGMELANAPFVHYPFETWFQPEVDGSIPEGMLDDYTLDVYNPDGELLATHLFDTNSGNTERGVCCIPYTRKSDGETVYFPTNLIENLYLSNGMSAGNTLAEAQVQCLSEIFERAVKKYIIEEELVLPDYPMEVLEKYPSIMEGIKALEEQGFPLLIKDASLGGKYPVVSITLMNPKTGGVFPCFGAHPNPQVAIERTLTELMQGRSFESLNDLHKPTFSTEAVQEPNNYVEHFIDSFGVISWKYFSSKPDFEFVEWNVAEQLANDDSFGDLNQTEREVEFLYGLLDELGLESYQLVHDQLGAHVCRILVPGYSEVYPIEDLIWDNTNKALHFREDILNLHRLSNDELRSLVERLEDSQEDIHQDIVTFIGIEFDENTVWGQLTILELMLLIYLALGELEDALDLTEQFLQYNDNLLTRNLFYQAMAAALNAELDPDLELDDFVPNFIRMFGSDVMEQVVGSIRGTVRFSGLTETSMNLEGIEPHHRLIDSLKRVHAARAKVAGIELDF